MLAVAGQEVDEGECSILMAGICNCYSYHPVVETAHPTWLPGNLSASSGSASDTQRNDSWSPFFLSELLS